MDNSLQEDVDRVESEISYTELHDDPSGADVDEEDDIEELRNSLKQIVQDEAVKPKLQCVMMDPSFSMVTVQSEDSGIVWETASSRCSTPWASEASSTSDAYSLEGSGTQGKIVIIMDEEKIIRKRKKKSVRGKLGERLRRPSSRNFPGGNERPFMTEVSVPNVRPENTEENGESKVDKEQELFNLVSEGYEILNIVVPSRLPTVDEEDSTEIADNLSYLEENPMIKSTPRHEQTQSIESSPNIIEIEDDDQVIVQVEAINVESSTKDTADKKALKDGTSDMDYFEKFTLLDEHIPGESVHADEKMEICDIEGNKAFQNHKKATNSLSASDDTFVFVNDVEIVSEHLDEVFYGNGHDDEHVANKQFENEEEEDSMDQREPLKFPVKESGSALFGSEETILTPIFLPSGPPKIIDPILLEEPTAMSFHYTDLYEDAVGVRKKEDDFSDVESVVSEKSFQRRLSDSDDANGYLEKFILKDETPVIPDEPITDDPPEDGRLRMWSQSKFELTGCLTRVVEEDDVTEEKEIITDGKRESPSPCKDSEAVMKMPEEKNKDSENAVLQEEVEMLGEKSPEICDGVFQTRVEDVEKTIADKKEIESTQPSDCLAEFELEETSEEIVSVREIKDTTEESIIAKSPEAICEGIDTSKEDNQVKFEEAAVDQDIKIMNHEIATEITVAPEETCEEIVSANEMIKDTTEESIVAKSPEAICEEIVPSKEENKVKSEEAAVDQDIEIMNQEKATEITATPEETCEEIVSVNEMIKDTTEKSIVAKGPEAICEEIVPSKEENQVKADEVVVDQDVEIMNHEIATEITVMPEEKCEEIASDRETVKDTIEESIVAKSTEAICEEIVPSKDENQVKSEEILVDQDIQIMNHEIATEITVTPEETCEEIVSVNEMIKDTTEESIVATIPEAICEEIIPSKEEIQVKSEEATVDQDIEIMNQEIATETMTPEETCEEIAGDRETIKDTTEESIPAQCPESTYVEVVPDIDEISRTEEHALDQDIVIMQQELVPELTVIKPEEACEEVVTDTQIAKEKVEKSVESAQRTESRHEEMVKELAESVDVQRTESVNKRIVADSENVEITAEQESVDQKVEAIDVFLEPEETIKDEIEEPERKAQEIITVSDISSGAGVESKDEVQFKFEPPDDFYAATTENDLKQKYPVTALEAREYLAQQEASMPVTEQTSEIEHQFPHKPSADEKISLIKEKEEAILLEDTGLQLLDDMRNYAETVGEAKKDESSDKELLNIHEWHRDNQSKTNSGIVEKRETMLLRLSPLVMAGVAEGKEGEESKVEERVLMEDEGLSPPLRSFSPQEDLSAFSQEAMLSVPFQFLHHDEEEAVELDYEMITQKEARELPDLDTRLRKDTEAEEVPDEALDSVQEMCRDQGLDADYEIIESLNGIPLSEAELAENDLIRQSLDTFCLICQCPISADDKLSGEHHDHQVTTVEKAYDDIKNKLSEHIAVLQERSENVTDMVSELELAYNSVEEHCKSSEQCLDEQNDDVMKMVMDQYNEMSQNMEEEKKVKLEQLYDRIVSFQESIDSAKEALEKSTKEVEETDPLTFVSSSKDIDTSLTSALDAALSLELTPSAFPLFEDYAKTPSGTGHKELKGIPVPQKPHLQAQEENSATSTSVTVYWKVNEGDIIDCFQVYCMEEPQGAVSEEYRVTVKESYSTLEDLEADKCYKVWVMAVNYTGCSLPSEKLSFRTAPSVPVIDTEKCTVCWDSATIRWSPTHPGAVESYTLEYCRQYACEGEGLRSISGIQKCEQKVLLHPNENYLFYIKAANSSGASEQSEAALISTRGTRFHLLMDTAHPALELTEDRATVYYHEDAFIQRATINECLGIQGELLPPRGYYYWETAVGSSDAYRIGVAYPTTAQDSPLGEDSTSWCIHCVPTATSCRFELLHDNAQTAIFTVEVPARIGTLLDFLRGRLSFFNAQNGQLLGSHWHRFTHGCHAVLALERPGALGLHMVSEVPEFAKH